MKSSENKIEVGPRSAFRDTLAREKRETRVWRDTSDQTPRACAIRWPGRETDDAVIIIIACDSFWETN